MTFIGKPPDPKPELPALRTFRVALDHNPSPLSELPQKTCTIDADYMLWSNGLVTFWETIEGGTHDHLVVAYPITRIHEITEP